MTFDLETAEIRFLLWPTLRQPLRCNRQNCDMYSCCCCCHVHSQAIWCKPLNNNIVR